MKCMAPSWRLEGDKGRFCAFFKVRLQIPLTTTCSHGSVVKHWTYKPEIASSKPTGCNWFCYHLEKLSSIVCEKHDVVNRNICPNPGIHHAEAFVVWNKFIQLKYTRFLCIVRAVNVYFIQEYFFSETDTQLHRSRSIFINDLNWVSQSCTSCRLHIATISSPWVSLGMIWHHHWC